MSIEGPSLEHQTRNAYDRLVDVTRRQHHPLAAHWELTYRCNERCSHCYHDVLPPRSDVPGELTTAECLRVIDDLAAMGALHLTFSGGEIFTRADFFEIAEYAHSRRFLLRLFSNGLGISSAVADRIAALHPYAVEISLYSTQANVHEKITRRARSFELTLRALRLLRERGVRTVMKTPLMRENVREFHALKTLAEELGAQFRYDTTITPSDIGGQLPLQHRMSYDDLVWLFRETLDPSPWLARTVKPDQGTCGIGTNSLLIDPYGNVFPCVQTRLSSGNVRTQSLTAIWEASPVWKELRCLTLDELPVCRTCELNSLCIRCHGLAKLEDGDLRGPAFANCREALARRQILVERGNLPCDYPIPMHLQVFAERIDRDLNYIGQQMPSSFTPLSYFTASRNALETLDDDLI